MNVITTPLLFTVLGIAFGLIILSIWTDINLCLQLLKQQNDENQRLLIPMANVNRLLLEKVEAEQKKNELEGIQEENDDGLILTSTPKNHPTSPIQSPKDVPALTTSTTSIATLSTNTDHTNTSQQSPASTTNSQPLSPIPNGDKPIVKSLVDTDRPVVRSLLDCSTEFWTMEKELELRNAVSMLNSHAKLMNAAEQRANSQYDELCGEIVGRTKNLFAHFFTLIGFDFLLFGPRLEPINNPAKSTY